MKKLAVLLSGRGSNFIAIHEAIERGALTGCRIVCAGSNIPAAGGLERALEFGIPAFALDHGAFASRADHERAVMAKLEEYAVDLVVLAGYMRKLSPVFIETYRNRILNIHPSLLPSFPGVEAQRQAFEHGVKLSGCTVHFVDESLDGGPIVVQRSVGVEASDTVEDLSARILEQEHLAYVEAIQLVVNGLELRGRRVMPSIALQSRKSGIV